MLRGDTTGFPFPEVQNPDQWLLLAVSELTILEGVGIEFSLISQVILIIEVFLGVIFWLTPMMRLPMIG